MSTMMNMHKILHSHKQWQEYNKQQDIGLMTLYHHQERTRYGNNITDFETNHLQGHREGPDSDRGIFDQCLHYDVEAELLARQTKEREMFPAHQAEMRAKSTKLQSCNLGSKNSSRSFHQPRVITRFQPKKQGIRLCQYDVAQLSNLRSQRALNEMPLPLLDRYITQKRQSLSSTQRNSPKSKLEKSLRLMSERKGANELRMGVLVRAVEEMGRREDRERVRQFLKEKAKINNSKQQRQENNRLKTELSSKPINYIDYKMINLRQSTRLNDIHSLRKQLKLSKIPKDSSRKGKIMNELNLIKLKVHSRTLMSGQTPQQSSRLREVISGYFTPVAVHKQRRHSQSL